MRNLLLAAATPLIFMTSFATAQADEGMWTFDQFPSAKVRQTYGWGPDQAWLNRVQASSVRLSSGCSASFVSGQALVLTNWHCVSDCVQNLSTADNDFAKNGFTALRLEDEKRCPGVEGEVLTAITDVTTKVTAATAGVAADKVAQTRAAALAAIETEACKGLDNKKWNCQVVNLYRGGQYKVYKYRIYEDMRLVFAPENAVGFFGGDPDNFNFPRFNLDAGFLRAYEDGKPVETPTHLTWTNQVPAENELVFVSGNPGSTQRQQTVSQLALNRDLILPTRQFVRQELRGRLIEYMTKGEEQKRQGTDTLFGVENSWKAQYGQLRALQDPAFLGIKQREEADLKARVRADPKLAREIGNPWAEIDAAVAKQRDIFMRADFLETRAGSISSLYGKARQLVRLAEERAKPVSQRMAGYSDQSIAALERQLLTESPIYKDQERIGLELWLLKTREYLTADDPAVIRLIGKDSPESIAANGIANTKLDDKATVQALISGGKAAIEASTDPLIQLARRGDADARAVRMQVERDVTGPISKAAERIAKARFAVYGASVYPDATFTLRLSYGKVSGWTHQGRTVPYFTTFAGYYDRATGSDPFKMSPRWEAAKSKLDLNTKYNIVTTNDIIGGNSGSPVIDRQGRVIGAAFDGNIHSLGGDFAYDGRLNRTVVVTTAAVQEALTKVYGMDRLVTELTAK